MRPDISMCDVGRLTIGKKNNCADRRETTRVIARGSPLRPIRFLRRVRAILCRVYDRIDGRTDGRMAREATVLGDYTIARYRARTQRETVRRETVPAFSASRSDIPNSLSLSLSVTRPVARTMARTRRLDAQHPPGVIAPEPLEQSFTALRGCLARRYIFLRVSRQPFKIAPLREQRRRIGRTRRADLKGPRARAPNGGINERASSRRARKDARERERERERLAERQLQFRHEAAARGPWTESA